MSALPYARNLDQTCHDCGRTEAAGDYCTNCGANTVDDWHPVKLSDAQRAALAAGAEAGAAHRFQDGAARRGSTPNPGDGA